MHTRHACASIDGHGNHPAYNDSIALKIEGILLQFPNQSEAFERVKSLIATSKQTLKNEVLLGTKNVNDITTF